MVDLILEKTVIDNNANLFHYIFLVKILEKYKFRIFGL